MRANLCGDKAMRGLRGCGESAAWLQLTEAGEVTPAIAGRNANSDRDFLARADPNSKVQSEIPTSARKSGAPILDNWPRCNELGGIEGHGCSENDDAKSTNAVRMELLVRWLRFNFVGGIGIAVQFFALLLLKSGLHLDYLLATALAVEAAVVHNFLWHERYTWADRVRPSWRGSLARLARFNLTTGGVSIVGNLALMRVMVGMGHMNYLVANGIAIALCSLANFLVSEEWVFEESRGR